MGQDILWAPWRASFILSKKEKGCIFCNRLKMPDTVQNLIIHRGRNVFAIMNKYPYNSGHLMIVPNRHVSRIEKLTHDESCEFFELTQLAVIKLKEVLNPQSFNLGMNIGKGSGAGVPGHIHMHIVPRWNGDTNFMPVVGDTKVVSVPLEPIYRALRKAFAKV